MKRISSCTLLLALLSLLSLGAPAWAAKVKICHVPPGNPANFHTITVSDNALPAHLGHGDLIGECSAHCSQLCSDGNSCTIDACDASGRCAADHPAVNCDDGNLCTTETCDPAAGCFSAPRVCTDGNLCTVDSCDPLTGDCVFPEVSCDPGETCNPANGNCEASDVDECASNPCMFGECQDQNNGYACICQPGWTGTNCDINIDECESSPCVHGQCEDQVNGYECFCEPGWGGTNCEVQLDPCAGVVCVTPATDFCEMLPGTCEEGQCFYAFRPEGTSCSNGQGTCTDDGNCLLNE